MCNTDCKGSPDSCISEQLYTAMADELEGLRSEHSRGAKQSSNPW